jgi:hypothetical protein
VKEIARTENDGAKKPVLSKRHLYNISRLPADQQDAVAQLVARDGRSAMETERLVDERVCRCAEAPTAGRRCFSKRRGKMKACSQLRRES